MGVERVNVPGNLFWLKMTMHLVRKGCLVFWVWFGVGCSRGSRASVGVDCFVPCPPSVAPRTLNPKPVRSAPYPSVLD